MKEWLFSRLLSCKVPGNCSPSIIQLLGVVRLRSGFNTRPCIPSRVCSAPVSLLSMSAIAMNTGLTRDCYERHLCYSSAWPARRSRASTCTWHTAPSPLKTTPVSTIHCITHSPCSFSMHVPSNFFHSASGPNSPESFSNAVLLLCRAFSA